ncbi:MAG TPA: hypothetical protein VNO43_04835 [Candidatus Eisenbacteria bacterium]|nr:hypothetical protein [Candidatus Eisenbacteria bacterium]
MFKQLLMAIIAASALAVFWTEADAITSNCTPGQPNCKCVQWTTTGGTRMCCAWRTKGILLELEFGQNCGPDGEACSAEIDVFSNNSIAFCVNPANPSGPPSRVACFESVTFSGPAEQCEPKHDQDNDNVPGGKGHDKGKHSCTSITVFTTPDNTNSCQAACTAALLGAVVDVVPVEMFTSVSAFAPLGANPYYYGEGEGLTECPSGSPACGMEQRCTIDPKKIQFGAVRPYQCVIENIFVPPFE